MYIYFANTLLLILFHYYFLKNKNEIFEKYVWMFSIFFLLIFIGFRYEIGGDWQIYNKFFFDIGRGDADLNLRELIDYGLTYTFINKIAYYLGIQFIGVNFIFALIFMHSLSRYLKGNTLL